MAEQELSQAEADSLIAVEKHVQESDVWNFPSLGEKLAIPLISLDQRESFVLDITRVRVKLTKITFQNRVRIAVVLLRLDIDGSPHRNPDGSEIDCPHIHIYREGFGDKWAFPIPADLYPDLSTFVLAVDCFMKHCNITQKPQFNWGLF